MIGQFTGIHNDTVWPFSIKGCDIHNSILGTRPGLEAPRNAINFLAYCFTALVQYLYFHDYDTS